MKKKSEWNKNSMEIKQPEKAIKMSWSFAKLIWIWIHIRLCSDKIRTVVAYFHICINLLFYLIIIMTKNMTCNILWTIQKVYNSVIRLWRLIFSEEGGGRSLSRMTFFTFFIWYFWQKLGSISQTFSATSVPILKICLHTGA